MISEKEKLRIFYKNIRKGLSLKRREEAEDNAFKLVSTLAITHKNIISFAPLPDEINIWKVNRLLSKEKNLFLPKVINNELHFFQVKDIESDLSKCSPFSILEPIIERCAPLADVDIITLAIIPGLAFDKMQMRIGYGKGHYDKFLVELKKCYSIGIGFKEQFYEKLLPIDKHDIALDEIILV